MASKIAKKKKTEQPVIEPQVIGEVAEAEAEEFVTPSVVESFVEAHVDNRATYSVKLDSKRFDNRDFHQVFALLNGAEGTFKKVVIEVE
jgi:hypothetical protein